MLQHRMKTLFSQPSKLDVRPRHQALRAIEGWYAVQPTLDEVTGTYYAEYLSTGSTLKFTRWLTRFKKLDNDFVTKVGNAMVATSVKVSCSHNDLLRLGDTVHYKSCMRNAEGMGKQQLLYLSDPDVAVAFVTDPAGKYVWRVLLRLAYSPAGVLSLVAYRVYGNGPTDAIFKAITAKTGLPIHKAVDIKDRSTVLGALCFVSPTIQYNSITRKPVWTDHLLGVTEQLRISIMVCPGENHAVPN